MTRLAPYRPITRCGMVLPFSCNPLAPPGVRLAFLDRLLHRAAPRSPWLPERHPPALVPDHHQGVEAEPPPALHHARRPADLHQEVHHAGVAGVRTVPTVAAATAVTRPPPPPPSRRPPPPPMAHRLPRRGRPLQVRFAHGRLSLGRSLTDSVVRVSRSLRRFGGGLLFSPPSFFPPSFLASFLPPSFLASVGRVCRPSGRCLPARYTSARLRWRRGRGPSPARGTEVPAVERRLGDALGLGRLGDGLPTSLAAAMFPPLATFAPLLLVEAAARVTWASSSISWA